MKHTNSLYGPVDDVAADSGHSPHPPRVGFFTDTSVCIGCKACEVACKEWNLLPADGFDLLGMSMDNTGSLGANTWRHVSFVEQTPTRGPAPEQAGLAGHAADAAAPLDVLAPAHTAETGAVRAPEDLGLPGFQRPGDGTGAESRTEFRWLMSSDVCKHCTHAGCLDVCPTGALFRTEFGTVVVQQDICNGCGYCVSGCPYGVIDRSTLDGTAHKCTLCYDRLRDGMQPACAQACPTQSIQFGELDELRERATNRVEQLRDRGVTEARLYGHDPNDGVGGTAAMFLLLDEPEAYGLPPDPIVPTRDAAAMWRVAGAAAAAFLAAGAAAFLGSGR